MLLKISIFNIFRNIKRSLLTSMVTVVGVISLVIVYSWINGLVKMLTDEAIKNSGYYRISHIKYDDSFAKIDIKNNFEYDSFIKNNRLKSYVMTNRFPALIYYGDEKYQTLGKGISNNYYKLVDFNNNIVEGRTPKGDNEIIVGIKIKDRLKLKLGSTLTILTNTQFDSMSALNYKVVGFFKMENGNLNRSFYINFNDSQYILDMDMRAQELLIFDKNYIKNNNKELKVMHWSEIGINREIVKALPLLKIFLIIIISILTVSAQSNTIIMSIYERIKEIRLYISLGMNRIKIYLIFLFESLILNIVGNIFGLIIGLSIAKFYSIKGINVGQFTEKITKEFDIKKIIHMEIVLGDIIKIPILMIIFAIIIGSLFILVNINKIEKNSLDR